MRKMYKLKRILAKSEVSLSERKNKKISMTLKGEMVCGSPNWNTFIKEIKVKKNQQYNSWNREFVYGVGGSYKTQTLVNTRN